VDLVIDATAAPKPPVPPPEITGVCRDPDDDRILACAVAHEAQYIVTGDKDLLVLGTFRGVKIVSPRDFELLFGDLDL